jgi:PKD repeat protein
MNFIKKNIALLLLSIIVTNAFAICNSSFTYQQPEPRHILFINESSCYDEGNIHYYWDFGDGYTSYDINPEHTYDNPGIYDVSLTIITSELCYDRDIKKVFVGIPPSSPYCALEILFETTNASAPDYNDGSASVYGFSDIPCCYYAYWSNNMEGDIINNLEPGTYCVTLTNGEQCFGTNCVTIGYNNNCTSSFLIDSTSFSHLEGAYRFVNNSHGEEDYYYWDFGDGTQLYGYSPIHVYDEPGTYNVCLEIYTEYDCTDVFCQEVTVGNTYPLVSNLYGTVNAGPNLLPQGIAVLYKIDGSNFSAIEYTLINEGNYQFTNLSKDFLYLTHLIPHFDTEETYFPKYIPTYTDNEVYWQNNNSINLYTDTIFVSTLESYNEIYFDEGTISGKVYYQDLSAYEQEIFAQSWILSITPQNQLASNMIVLLKNSNHEILDFKLTDSYGEYQFKDLEYGAYYLSVEKAGIISDELYVEIFPDNPENQNNDFNITQNNITGIADENLTKSMTMYPNPCTDFLLIENIPHDVIQIEIIRNDGQKIKSFFQITESLEIDIRDLSSGIYLTIMHSNKGIKINKFIKY